MPLKFKSVRDGEQAVVYNYLGEGELLTGPCRVYLFRKRLQKLVRYTATEYEYLEVEDNNGFIKHLPGPCDLFNNPLEISRIRIHNGIKIDANHMIVVYNKTKDSSVERRIIQGPTLFIPTADEWLHNFAWHGADSNDKTRMIPGHNKFEHLPCIPDQFYYNVHDVRTNDDTMVTVKLMIFYVLKDVIVMLENTHDPIGDMINAVCADVISFAGKMSFETMIRNTHKLGELETFPQLATRSEKIGYEISKVVYRGYHSSEQLQLMQDNAIQSRTQLRLNSEIQEQQHKLHDFKLQKEQARTKMRQDMENKKEEHHQMLSEMKQEHTLVLQHKQHIVDLDIKDKETQAQIEIKRKNDEHKLGYLKQLQDNGVDLTKYLTSQQGAPVAQEYQVVTLPKESTF